VTPFTAGIVVFAVYLVAMITIGFVSGRQQRTTADLWVAGRRFGTVAMVLGLMASIMHGGSILSGVALAGSVGGVAMLPFMSFALGFLVILVFFARKLRDTGGFTLSDFMGQRFESTPLRAFSALVIAVSSIVYLIAQIRGMGFILEALLGIPFASAMTLGTALFVFYVALGGMLAIIWTNIAQFLFMWLGLLVLMPSAYAATGGWSTALARADALAPGWTSVRGTEWTWSYVISWWIVWFVAYATRIELITKVFIARDSRVARYALPTTCLLVMLFLLYGNLYLGAAARVLVWDQIGAPDQAFPALVRLLLGPIGASVALTGIAAAAMSTTDSLLLLSGAAVSHDLLRKSLHEPRGIAKSEGYYVTVSRIAIVAVGMVSLMLAFQTPQLILAIVSYAVAMIAATFFFPLIFGLWSRRTTPAAATASSVMGFFTTVLWTALTLAQVPWAAAIHPVVPGLLVALVLIVGVTPFTKPSRPEALERFFGRPAAAPATPLA
jgi:sodium/pantothenate symporter